MPEFTFVETQTFKYTILENQYETALKTKEKLEPEDNRKIKPGAKREKIGEASPIRHASVPVWDVKIVQDYGGPRDQSVFTVVGDSKKVVEEKAWEKFDEVFDSAEAREADHVSASIEAEERHGDRTIKYTV